MQFAASVHLMIDHNALRFKTSFHVLINVFIYTFTLNSVVISRRKNGSIFYGKSKNCCVSGSEKCNQSLYMIKERGTKETSQLEK